MLLKLLVVKPAAETVPVAMLIPEPAVNGACTSVPITKPKFVLAAAAVFAPVPPLAMLSCPVILEAATSLILASVTLLLANFDVVMALSEMTGAAAVVPEPAKSPPN